MEPPIDSATAAQLAGFAARLDALDQRLATDGERLDERIDRVMEILHRIFDREQDDRRRLARCRADPDYTLAFTEPDPLVSVVIPTWTNVEQLIGRSLPSVLAQDHPNLEVIVVGDAAGPATEEAIAALGDPRVRYANLTLRGPYPDDPDQAWLVSGTAPYNAAVRLARGRWIAPMADDDQLEPHALRVLLGSAREQQVEFVYGKLLQVLPDGSENQIGKFPPEHANIGLQASMYHAGLAFMELELGHALFGTPNDWGLIRRMCLAGVRIGFVDEVLTQYFPSMRSPGFRSADDVPATAGAAELGLRAERDVLASRVAALEIERDALRTEVAATGSGLADLQRRLDVILSSRRWRWTALAARAVTRARQGTGGARGRDL